MPLHTTLDFDGRKKFDGSIEQKGIHARLDAFPERHGITAEEIARGLKARARDDVWEAILNAIKQSHGLVDRCYDLDGQEAFVRATPESRALVLQQCREGAQLTMDLWYTAWLDSAKMPRHY